jgi:hypothetical protein
MGNELNTWWTPGTMTTGQTITFPHTGNLQPQTKPRDFIIEGDLILKGRVIRDREAVEDMAELVLTAKVDQLEALLKEALKRIEELEAK